MHFINRSASRLVWCWAIWIIETRRIICHRLASRCSWLLNSPRLRLGKGRVKSRNTSTGWWLWWARNPKWGATFYVRMTRWKTWRWIILIYRSQIQDHASISLTSNKLSMHLSKHPHFMRDRVPDTKISSFWSLRCYSLINSKLNFWSIRPLILLL
jgi:hypothetical protein